MISFLLSFLQSEWDVAPAFTSVMELDNMKTTPDTAGTESNGQSTENDKTPQTQTEPGEQPGTGKDSVGKGQHDAEVVYRPSTTTREDEEDDQEKGTYLSDQPFWEGGQNAKFSMEK